MKSLEYVSRFFAMGLWVCWYAIRYAFGRISVLARVRDTEQQKEALATYRGTVLRALLTRLGATFVKLGQVLSTRPDLLEKPVIDELRKLQDRMPPFPFAKAKATIEGDLGRPLSEIFSEFDEKPVAAASVAQVHRARLHDGREVAVKVLRPDVRHKVERDEVLLLAGARLLNLSPELALSDPVGHIKHFVDGILEQTNLKLEAANYLRFHENFAGFEGVRFPTVIPELSGEHMMTMDFIRGSKIDALPPGDHRWLARRTQEVILKMCFVDGFVHADLHPGNLMIDDAGHLVIFDVGLVKSLGGDLFLQFIDFTKCLTMGTPRDFVIHMKRFHSYATNVDWVAFETDMAALVSHFRKLNAGELEIGGLANDLFALGRRHRVRPPADLALIIVGMITAEGIGKQLHPNNNLLEATAAYLMPLLAGRGLSLASA